MTQREEVSRLCRSGISPMDIARQMKISLYKVKTHLWTQVGEGDLRRSDVLFSISNEVRHEFAEFAARTTATGYWPIINAAVEEGFSKDEFRLYYDLTKDRVWRGDLYEFIVDIEIALHTLVRQTLTGELGADESEWWRQGVPKSIRVACVSRREEDPDPVDDSFSYTTFIHLSDIIDKNWPFFQRVLPKKIASNRKLFTKDMRRLNSLRNTVMHPVKQIEITENDFLFARNFYRTLNQQDQKPTQMGKAPDKSL